MKGLGVSPGVAIGRIFVKKELNLEVEKQTIQDVPSEQNRLDTAVNKTLKEIEELYETTIKDIGKNEAEIFLAHKMMAEDPEFIGMAKNMIANENVNAEWAIVKARDTFVQLLEGIKDEYLRERATDVIDVSNRIIANLLGIENTDISFLEEECILVSNDLAPSDTAQMDKDKVLGFITEVGGKTSHTSIMARTLEIPAVVGVKDITLEAKNGDIAIVDGNEGLVILNPTDEKIGYYRNKKKKYEDFTAGLKQLKGKKTISKDGFEVEVAGNIGTPNDIDRVIENDGEGVGLYRTEFLYMDRSKLPTEEEQFQAYKIVAEKLEGKPLVIRTLDIGGDKDLPYLNLPKEMNPFLGYRAIRLCLDRKDIFKTQLRAILRASVYGNIKIMFPMISNLEEILSAKAIIEEVKSELKSENIAFNENIEIGIMVEIPAAAIQSDILAKEVDFFSIGTNDLIQYTLAVDRGNQDISYLYSQYHPAVLRLINTTIQNGHKEGIWVGMCGEAAGDEKLIPLLLGMGLDEFSMSSSSILKARWIIRQISKTEMKCLVGEALNLPLYQDVEKYMEEKITSKF